MMRLGQLLLPFAVLAVVTVPMQGQNKCTASGTSVTTAAIKKSTESCTASSGNSIGIVIATPTITSYTNPAILQLTTSTTTLTLAPSIAALDSGRTPWVATTLTIRANRTWKVLVSSSAATWTGTGTFARQNKPVGDLQWRISSPYASTAWTSLSSTATQVAPQSGSGSAGGSNSVTLNWSARLSWTSDSPGAYSLPVTLTLTTP